MSDFLVFCGYKNSFNSSMVEHTGILESLFLGHSGSEYFFFFLLPLKAEWLFCIMVVMDTTSPRPALNCYTRNSLPKLSSSSECSSEDQETTAESSLVPTRNRTKSGSSKKQSTLQINQNLWARDLAQW